MITIGYSTRKPNPEFQEKIKKSIGLKEFTIIEKINNGEKSLTQVYNEILDESKTDIIVLCHDDLIFETEKWGKKVLNHFNNTEFGVIGVAGTTSIPESGRWWEDPSKMVGIVNHKHEGKKWESKYCKNWGDEIVETILVDGLFISLSKNRIKNKFNSNIPDFHFYDVDFSFKNHLSGVKVGVMFDVRLTHLSIGMTNDKWESNRELFVNDVKENLPYFFIPKTENLIPDIKFYEYKNRINVIIQSNGDKNDFISLYKNIKNFKHKNLIINLIVNDENFNEFSDITYEDVKIRMGHFDSMAKNLSILKWEEDLIIDDDLIFLMPDNITILNDVFSSFSKIFFKNKKQFSGGFPITLNPDGTIVSSEFQIIKNDDKILFNLKHLNSFYNFDMGVLKNKMGNISPLFVCDSNTIRELDWFNINYDTILAYNDFVIQQLKYNKEPHINTSVVIKLKNQINLEKDINELQKLFTTINENKKLFPILN
jgi:hypothetical protein